MNHQNYLTTYEISRMCRVGLTTVIAWANEGKLPAFRTPGGHRRVRYTDFVNFLQKYEMPLPPELQDRQEPRAGKILIVDDDALTVKILSKALRGMGRIFTAADGFAAGFLVQKEMPDVILLDIFLPGMDGFEVCRRLKKSPDTSHIKVMAITASRKSEVRENILAVGAEECFVKPLKLDWIKKMVSAILGESAQSRCAQVAVLRN